MRRRSLVDGVCVRRSRCSRRALAPVARRAARWRREVAVGRDHRLATWTARSTSTREVLTFEKVSDVGGRRRGLRAPARASSACGCASSRLRLGDEQIELTEYLAPRGPADPGRLAQQRPLVPARRDHRQRHGPGLRAAARAQGPARVDRAAAPARLEPERRRHRGVLLQGSRRPRAGDPRVPAGQGRSAVAAADGSSSSSASTTPRSSSATPRRACASIATRSACASRARARTTAPSRST